MQNLFLMLYFSKMGIISMTRKSSFDTFLFKNNFDISKSILCQKKYYFVGNFGGTS